MYLIDRRLVCSVELVEVQETRRQDHRAITRIAELTKDIDKRVSVAYTPYHFFDDNGFIVEPLTSVTFEVRCY